MHVVELDNKFAIWIKHTKTKTRSVVALPLTKTLHEILAIHLKEWSHDKKIWLLHIIDHATKYSVSYVALSKKKDIIVKKIFKHFIGFFDYLKILVDDGGEFYNDGFKTLCEIFNIQICTTAAESPWNSDLIDRHNAIKFDCFQTNRRDKM